MTTTTSQRQPDLTGQIVVVIGGGAGTGLQAARRPRAGGSGLIRTGRNPDHPKRAAAGLGAVSKAASGAADPAELERFPSGPPEQIGHVMVTAAGPAVR